MAPPTRPCEVCGRPIDPERVETVPETRLCTEHAREIDKYGGEFVVTYTRERLNKEKSMKPVYGSVTPSRRRNEAAIERLREEYLEGQDLG
jgi:hypothetical protein